MDLVIQLYDRYGGAVLRRCRQLLGDEEQARDATQEVFLRALDRRSSFRGSSAPFTWLYSIATTHCLQQLRNQRRRSRKLEDASAAATEQQEGSMDDRITVAQLFEAVEPELQQMALLRHVDGLTVEEVAEAVGMSRKTVTRKLERLGEQLRGKLGTQVEVSRGTAP